MRIAVLFARLGPYHVARLRALSEDHDVGAVELSGTNLNYDWAPVAVDGLTHTQLFDGNHRSVEASRLRRRVAATLSEQAPDVVAVPGWWDPGALAALAWARRRDVPVVLMSDSTALDAPRVWWREWPKQRIVSLFDTALVAGSRHTDYLAQLGFPRDRIWRGYDVVDNAHFAEGADAARERADEKRTALGLPERYVLACGRFVEKKNLDQVIEAYAQYRARAEAPRALVLVGDGSRREGLEEQVRALGLQDDVYFPGFCQYDELPPYYGLADAFIHASTHEQWGLVVNEAMAAGLPVLVSDRCGCAPDLVEEGENGFTFDPYDADQMAAVLGRVPADEGQRRQMGRASRTRIQAWTPQTFAQNLGAAAECARTGSAPSLSWDQSVLIRALTWKSSARVS